MKMTIETTETLDQMMTEWKGLSSFPLTKFIELKKIENDMAKELTHIILGVEALKK